MNELASEHGFLYETTKASIDEASLGSRTARPEDLVLLLARAKAEAIKSRYSSRQSGILITCDQAGHFNDSCLRLKKLSGSAILDIPQVVVQEGKILEKPRSSNEVSCPERQPCLCNLPLSPFPSGQV